jgi:hypothetical protein
MSYLMKSPTNSASPRDKSVSALKQPTIHGLTRANLEAQLADAIKRRCWWAEDAIRADLRALALLEADREVAR